MTPIENSRMLAINKYIHLRSNYTTDFSMEQDSKKSHDHVETDIKSSLDSIIGESGIVKMEFGGFVITILDNAKFPWYDTLNIIAGKCFDVWVNRKDTHLIIVAKQKID
jgi:hypothetical protein